MMNCKPIPSTICDYDMSVLDSLSINILVLNSKLQVLGINQAARSFLKYQSIETCFVEKQLFVTGYDYVKLIINNLKLGTVVSNKRLMVRKFDESVVLVELFAHSYSTVDDAFLFMFYELKPMQSIMM